MWRLGRISARISCPTRQYFSERKIFRTKVVLKKMKHILLPNAFSRQVNETKAVFILP
jgi:hypothetical protein